MKSFKFLIILLLFSLKGYTQQYGNWVRSNCYSFIETRIKFEESYPINNGKFTERNVLVQIKNNSSKRIVLAYHISINKDIKQVYKIVNGNLQTHNINSSYSGSTGVLEIDPHQTITDGMHMINIQDNQTLWIEISCIKEYNNDNKTLKQYYTRCDNGNLCSACQFSSTSSCDDYVNPNHSQNSTGSSGTSSMNRGGNIVTSNSNTQNQNNPQEEITKQQQEKIRLQQEKTNQEVEKANQDIAKAKEKIYEQSRQEQITNINEQNKIVNNTIETVNNTITEGTKESNNSKINNQQILKTTQEKYKIFNLSEKEIKTLLSNSSKNDYVTIFVYNQHKVKNNTSWNVYVNGYKIAALVKGEKTEYRVYQCDNELTVQLISVGGFLQIEKPIITQTIRVKKGKDYHFTIKQKGLNYIFEQIDSEPENNKLVNKFKETKSDIEY